MPTNIRVLIVDDHAILREGFRDVLDDVPGFSVVGLAATGEECLPLAKKLKPDIVIMDIQMPGMGGLEATRRLKKELPDVKVVVLSTHEDEGHIMEAFRMGARGYLPKTHPTEKTIESLRQVFAGKTVAPDAVLSKLVSAVQSGADAAPVDKGPESLSETEIQILRLVKQGLQNKEVGQKLDISEKTVRNHLNTVFDKLGAISRTDAIIKAIQKGILPLHD